MEEGKGVKQKNCRVECTKKKRNEININEQEDNRRERRTSIKVC
jgi:hypothetical protein